MVGVAESEVTIEEIVEAQEDEDETKDGESMEENAAVEEEPGVEEGTVMLVVEVRTEELEDARTEQPENSKVEEPEDARVEELVDVRMVELEGVRMEETADEGWARANVDPSDDSGVGTVHTELDDVLVTEEAATIVLEVEALRRINVSPLARSRIMKRTKSLLPPPMKPQHMHPEPTPLYRCPSGRR